MLLAQHGCQMMWCPNPPLTGCYAGAVAVAFTYANGFYHLMKKNQQGWANTFRHRMFILVSMQKIYAYPVWI